VGLIFPDRQSLIGRMGQDQHDTDELARMEPICLDLAEESRVTGEVGSSRVAQARRGYRSISE
jgi:hypothetical protein